MSDDQLIQWDTNALSLRLTIAPDGVVRLQSILPRGVEIGSSASKYFDDSSLPLTEIRFAGNGNASFKTSKGVIGSYASVRLKYRSHRFIPDKDTTQLEIVSHDKELQITVEVILCVYPNIPVVRSWATVRNDSDQDLILSQVSSLVIGGMTTSCSDWWHKYILSTATNSWFREAQWRDQSLPDLGIDDVGLVELPDNHRASYANHTVSSRGGFSTGTYLPMGMLKRNDGKETWIWQIEHNGSWKWEIGDFQDSVYLAACGPIGLDHSCSIKLPPGKTFVTIPAAVCHVLGGPDDAFSVFTEYRRRIRRKHEDNENLPVIFNDFMNCLMADPTEEKVMRLVGPAVKAGAEYYVIDAGWYADGKVWWNSIGAWKPSNRRFPSGFKSLIDNIRSKGLLPGLWLEPESVGIESEIATELPEEAFFQECGQRVLERDRYQLDFRHPAVVARMNRVVDDLVNHYGIAYLKFDYNVEFVRGTDVSDQSPGAGHLEHCRAYLQWVQGIYDRHPKLVIENCSSGGQRMDYAMLAIHSLQSTSDQQDPVRYAVIAAAAPTAVTPEQGASWAYPQPEWSDEMNAFTVVNSLLGRVHLSGRLDLLSESQLSLVASGIEVYKSIRHHLKQAVPFWPIGLPRWHDDWIALGMSSPNADYLSVWRRGGSTSCDLPLLRLKGRVNVHVELLYPKGFEAKVHWYANSGNLNVMLPPSICARCFKLTLV